MNSLIHRKDRIILSAIDILGDLGIQGLSTREIAKRQNISEGTLFKHFKSKQEILLGMLDYFSKFDREIMQTIKIRNYSIKDAIHYLVHAFASYYENYPALVTITLNFNGLASDENLTKKIKVIYENRSNFLKERIMMGKEKGEVASYVRSGELADVILGTIRETCLRWEIEDQSFSLHERCLAAVNVILDSNIFVL